MRQDQAVAAAGISPDMALGGSLAIASAHPVSHRPRKGRRLLWVDDSRSLLSLYKSVFESLGFEVLATSSPEEALQHMASDTADVAILDYDMPEMDGGVLASLMKDRCPMLPVILYSGSTCIPHSAHHWVDAICAKSAPREELLTMIERLLRKASKAQASESPRCFTPSSNQ
ncbi:MAG: response regulator [Terriglobales bacterium]